MQGQREDGPDLVARRGDVLAEQVDAGADEAARAAGAAPRRAPRARWPARAGRGRRPRDRPGAGWGAMSSARRPWAEASRWWMTASVATMTRSPMRWARQQKSRSSRKSGRDGSKPVEGLPDVATDQHARRADGQDVADAVVLPLVVLAALEPGDAPTGAGDGDAGLQQQAPVVPAEHLGPEDRHARVVVGGVEEPLEAVARPGALSSCRSHTHEIGIGGERLVGARAEVGKPRADGLRRSRPCGRGEGCARRRRRWRAGPGWRRPSRCRRRRPRPGAASGWRGWSGPQAATRRRHG